MKITTEILRLDTAVAELLIVVDAASTGCELRGRLMGPSCPGADTIEVAYPLKAVPGKRLAARVVIPEPNFWDEETPYVYRGPVEVWWDGVRLHSQQLEVGLKSRPT